jgi:hypothetical protein
MSPVSNRLRAYLPLQAVQTSGSTAQELEVAVNICNQMLVIDGSFCYLSVNTQTFYIGS